MERPETFVSGPVKSRRREGVQPRGSPHLGQRWSLRAVGCVDSTSRGSKEWRATRTDGSAEKANRRKTSREKTERVGMRRFAMNSIGEGWDNIEGEAAGGEAADTEILVESGA